MVDFSKLDAVIQHMDDVDGKQRRAEIVSDVLCDLYDIQNMARLKGFGELPKDNDGTETTIMDCIDNCIEQLSGLQ